MVRPMKLIEHIQSHEGTATPSCPVLARIASDAGISAATLYLVARGLKTPGWRMAGAIEKATSGAVTRQDLRPDVFGPVPTSTKAA